MNLITLAAAAALLVATTTAEARVVLGTFTGTIDSGTDTTGVFSAAGTDLANQAITGTLRYDTNLLAVSTAGTSTSGLASGSPGALQFTVTIGGVSHTFLSATTASVSVDTSISDVTLITTNDIPTASFPILSETASLDAFDPIDLFTSGNGLEQDFAASPLLSSGAFTIGNLDPLNVLTAANGTFSITSLSLTALADEVSVPEPSSVIVLLSGLAFVWIRRRQVEVRNIGGLRFLDRLLRQPILVQKG